MLAFLATRALSAMVTLLAVTMAVFGLSRLSGDPRGALLPDDASKDLYDQFGKELGLDKPVYVQYLVYISHLVRGDLGKSVLQRKPVIQIIRTRLPNSAQLALSAFIFSLAVGVPLGVLAAVKRGSFLDYAARWFAMIGQAMPVFWIALVLIFFFGVTLGWLPTSRKSGVSSFVLPTVTLGWFAASGQVRLLRSSMLDVLDSEYVKLARAKGVSGITVLWKHALRNAMIAPLTFAGLTLAGLISGSIVIETVFAWPGLGALAFQSVSNSDFPILQGVILLVTCFYVLANLLVDLTYAVIDPRIKYR